MTQAGGDGVQSALPDLFFDRRVSQGLIDALGPGGPLRSLVRRRDQSPGDFDVQLRRDQKGHRSWASFYAGLTSVLDVDHRPKQDVFRLRAHQTHRDRGGFEGAWSSWQSLESLKDVWSAVDAYLDRVIVSVDRQWTSREGVVHGAIASDRASEYRIINREASPAFRDQSSKEAVLHAVTDPILATIARPDRDRPPWWPTVVGKRGVSNLGTSCDFLAIDSHNRILAMEAKPASALSGIVRGPIQVRVYAELIARWLRDVPDAWRHLVTMLEQRIALGLSRSGVIPEVVHRPVVVPVLGIGAGEPSKAARTRMSAVVQALAALQPSNGIDPLEIWRLDKEGQKVGAWL